MKIVACYIVLNEEDYLELSLTSVYDLVDEIIIIEGAERICDFCTTSDGLSIDHTSQIIQKFYDPFHKIKYIQKGWVDWQGDLRNEYLKQLPKDTDWFLVVDGDEIYHRGELGYALQMIKQPKFDYTVLGFTHLMFYRDIFHIKHDNNEMRFDRLFKYSPNLFYQYPGDTNLIMKSRKLLRFAYTNVYHFGWARSKNRLLDKLAWTKKYQIQRYNQHPHLQPLNNKQLKEYLLHNHELFQPLSKQHNVFNFRGRYPTFYITKRWEQIHDKVS